MTSWPDQPPQTRRQAREHQRAAEREQGATPPQQQVPVSRRAATIAPTTAGEVPDVATPYSFASAQRGAAAQKSSAQQTAVQEADEQQSASVACLECPPTSAPAGRVEYLQRTRPEQVVIEGHDRMRLSDADATGTQSALERG